MLLCLVKGSDGISVAWFLEFWRVLFGPVAGGGQDREGPLVVEGKLL
jgi:hypothetical protein